SPQCRQAAGQEKYAADDEGDSAQGQPAGPFREEHDRSDGGQQGSRTACERVDERKVTFAVTDLQRQEIRQVQARTARDEQPVSAAELRGTGNPYHPG